MARAQLLRGLLAETWCVARAEMRQMATSVGALFLVLAYGAVAGSVGAFLGFADRQLGGKLSGGLASLGELERGMLLEQAKERGLERLLEAMLRGDLPPMVLGVLYLSTFVVPALILIVGYHRISEDLSTRFIRYLLQRVHRGTYLAGKLIGHWIVSLAAILAVHVALLGYAAYSGAFDARAALPAVPRVWAAMAVFVLAYSSYTLMCSAVLKPPFLALVLGVLGLFAVKVGTWILSFVYPPLGELWLGSWDVRLWALDPWAIVVYLAYAALFVVLAHAVLRRRDL